MSLHALLLARAGRLTTHRPTAHRHRLTLGWLLRISIAGTFSLSVLQMLQGETLVRFFALGVIFSIACLAYGLMLARRVSEATAIFCAGVWLAVSGQAVLAGGLANPGLMLYPALVLISGWLLGLRAALVTMVASVVCIVGLGMAVMAGLIVPDAVNFNPVTRAAAMSIIVGLTFASLYFLLKSHDRDLQDIGVLNAKLEQQLQGMQQQEAVLRHTEAQVRLLNAELESRVQQRTEQLQQALETLRRAQEELVHSEKMAALGNLVAGVAHELNTPVGTALTAASSLADSARTLEAAMASGALKKSQLDAFVQRARTGSDLVQRSLERAAHLVESFKQVAVDQASERRRTFYLDDVVNEVVDTLRPNLRHQPWTIDIQVPGGLELDSFPGPLGQIVINLVMNSAIHAFTGRAHGSITLSARPLPDGAVELVCADDGVGMDRPTLGRIFEPFFTTKLGQGGSGLGMAIVHRLVTQVLGGTIQVESAPGAGTRFVLRLPLHI